MTSPRDPEELFRAAKPYLWGDNQPVNVDDDPKARAILDRVFNSTVVSIDDARTSRRHRGRWWAGGIVVGAIVVGGGTAVAVHFLRDEPTDLRGLSCWSAAIVPLPPEQVALKFEGSDPVALCRAAWTSGAFTSNGIPENLTACVSETGIVVVIPGHGPVACDAIGLAAYTGTRAPHLEAISQAENELNTQLNETTCVPYTQAKQIAESILAKYDLDDWVIVSGEPFTDERPCAAVAVVADTKMLHLNAVQRTPDLSLPPINS